MQKKEENVEEFADEINAAHYSQGHVAAGLTSTTMEPITQNKAAVLGDDTVRSVHLFSKILSIIEVFR